MNRIGTKPMSAGSQLDGSQEQRGNLDHRRAV
jgi:hypothetical protein